MEDWQKVSEIKLKLNKNFKADGEIKRRCSILSVVANLFYAIGDFKHCEDSYVKYIQMIEDYFGPDSLETANCYFLMGVFYL